MTDPKISFEDVLGADQAGREIRARDHAALYEIAIRTGNIAEQHRIVAAAGAAGHVRELRAARRELVHAYALNERPRGEAIAILRQLIQPDTSDEGA